MFARIKKIAYLCNVQYEKKHTKIMFNQLNFMSYGNKE